MEGESEALGLAPREEPRRRVRRAWKILIGVLVVLAALLAINTVIVDNQTKEAEVTIEGGRILSLPGGDVQVFEQGPELPARGRARRSCSCTATGARSIGATSSRRCSRDVTG